MTGSLEDTKAQVPRPRAACIHCHHVIELSPPLEGRPAPTWVHIATGWVPCSLTAEPPRAAGVVPAEPATHDTSRWEAHRSYGIRDTLTGGTLWCHDADQEPSGAVRDAALAALAAVGGEAPAT